MILSLRHLKHNGKKILLVSKVGLNTLSNLWCHPSWRANEEVSIEVVSTR
jgi:hypothetical protein